MTAAAEIRKEAPEPVEADYFTAVLAAAERLRVSVADRIRLDQLLVSLASSGIAAADRRLPFWAAAAVCRTAEERTRFLRDLGVTPGQTESDPKKQGEHDATGPRSPAPPRLAVAAWLRRRWRAGAVIAVIGIIALFALWHLIPDPVDCASCGRIDRGTGMVPEQVEERLPVEEQQWTWGAVALAVPFLCLAFWLWWYRRTRARILAKPPPAPNHRSSGMASAELRDLFLQGRAGFRRLLRHRTMPGRSINVPASIALTIRAGGFPTIQHGLMRRTPEYLLLSERKSPSDHLALLARTLVWRMTSEQVLIRHYEFFREPAILHRVDGPRQQRPEPLATVLADNSDARIFLLMEGDEVMGGEKEPPWLRLLADQHELIHFNPRPPALWGAAEQRLDRAGLQTLHISGAGLARLDRSMPGSTGRGLAHEPGTWDLPATYRSHMRALLSDEPPHGVPPETVVDDLLEWLDRGSGQWLAALALYPRIVPALTVSLGKSMRDTAGAPLFSEERLLELARLPWCRAGVMPDWLRVPLARRLTPESLRQALPVVQRFLAGMRTCSTPEGNSDTDAAAGARERAELVEWLSASPESELHDRLLIDLLKEKRPHALAREPLAALPPRLRRLLRARHFHEALATVTLLAAIVILVPPEKTVLTEGDKVTLVTRMRPGPSPTADPAPRPPADTAPGKLAPGPAKAEDPPRDAEAGGNDETAPITTGTPPTGSPVGSPYMVFFDWQNADINDQARAILSNAAAAAAQLAPVPTFVRIDCFTDTTLPRAAARRLTATQCANVKADLKKRLSDPTIRFYTVAHGWSARLAETADGVREPQNRRAEIVFYTDNRGEQLSQDAREDLPQVDSPSTGQTVPSAEKAAPVAQVARPTLLPPDTGLPLLTRPVGREVTELDNQSDRLYDQKDYEGAYDLNERTCRMGSYRGCFWNGYLEEARLVGGASVNGAIEWYDRACRLRVAQGCTRARELRSAREAK